MDDWDVGAPKTGMGERISAEGSGVSLKKKQPCAIPGTTTSKGGEEHSPGQPCTSEGFAAGHHAAEGKAKAPL